MKKLIIIEIVVSILSLIFWFIVFSFVVMNLNPANWGEDTRLGFVFTWILSIVTFSIPFIGQYINE